MALYKKHMQPEEHLATGHSRLSRGHNVINTQLRDQSSGIGAGFRCCGWWLSTRPGLDLYGEEERSNTDGVCVMVGGTYLRSDLAQHRTL